MANNSTAYRSLRYTFYAIAALLLLLPMSVALIYVPAVQDALRPWICQQVSDATGLQISVDKLRLRFPLDLELGGLLVVAPQAGGDTMAQARSMYASVEVMPLLHGQVEVERARLLDGRYRMTTDDSSMMLHANVRQADIEGIALNIDHNEVAIANGRLQGGKVHLDYYPHKAVPQADSVPPQPWHIRAHKLDLEDIDYDMSMLPTIDKLQTHITRANLRGGKIDTGAHTVKVRSVSIDSANVRYHHPSEADAAQYAARHPLIPDTLTHLPQDSIPWTVNVDTVRVSNTDLTYALTGHQPAARGLDTDHIALTGFNATVTDVYNRDTDVALRINDLRFAERSGLTLTSGQGHVAINDAGIDIDSLRLSTIMSNLQLSAHIDQSLLNGTTDNGLLAADTHGQLALQEVTMLMPELAPTLKDIPQIEPLRFDGKVSGNTRQLNLNKFTLDLPRYATATVSGSVVNPTDINRLAGELDIDADFKNINFVKPGLLDIATQKQVDLPPMALKGKVRLDGDNISGQARMTVHGGELVGEGSFNSRNNRYDIDARFNNFPVHAILPLSETDNLTAHIKASGEGFDFLKPSAAVQAELDLGSVNYRNAIYQNLRANVTLKGGAFSGKIASTNPNCDIQANVNGTIADQSYRLHAQGRINDLNLHQLGLLDMPCNGKANFSLNAAADTRRNNYDADLRLSKLNWNVNGTPLIADSLNALMISADTLTRITIHNESNLLTFQSPLGLDSLTAHFTRAADIAAYQMQHISVNIDTLQQALPPFAMRMRMGTDGIVQRLMAEYDADMRNAMLTVTNDSNIAINGQINSFSIGQIGIDTLTIKATEWKKYLAFRAHMGNRRGTWDDMASVTIDGGVRGPTIDFLLTQHDIKQQMGYRIGCNATLNDSAAKLRFFPEQPVIAYRKWTVNRDNFVNYEYATRMVDADLKLQSDSSLVSLVTRRQPGDTTEQFLVDIKNLKIEEWTQLLPSLPQITGRLDADIDITYNGHDVEGTALTQLSDFTYNERRQGNWVLNANYSIDPATMHTNVEADLLVDNQKVVNGRGALTDMSATAPFTFDLNLTRFPLTRLSAFVPGRMVSFRGFLIGKVNVTGTPLKPIVNGYLQGDSAHIRLPRYGADLALDTVPLVVNGNILSINDYRIYGLNDSAIHLAGKVDLRNIDNPVATLQASGNNIQFIGSEQRGFSEVFGKAFADINANVRLRDNRMNVTANLTVLPGSNITYVLKEDINSLTGQTDENMVTFLNFDNNDSGAALVTSTATGTITTNLQANLTVEQGAVINAYLSEDGKDRATINGNGNLRYTLDFAGKDNLSGTYTVESGSVRYTPPVVSQKNFNINSGGTVTWTGDMLNPQLDLSANQQSRTSVANSNGQGSRLVDFLVTAHLGGTLTNLQLDFDMDCQNDLSVQNELQSMTETQRSQAAINLLLYNSYSGSGSVGNLSGLNATSVLFSMLQSQLNNLTQKSLKGVELSFGINQFENSTGTGTQTSYSYRLSKSLFNDRFKVVVGGEYSTGASAEDNFSQNLINDISFEYLLNATGSKYVRLFRHQNTPSLLEGQITETGVGLVLKSKVPNIAHFFRGRSAAERARQDSLAARRQLRQQMRLLREQAQEAAADSTANQDAPTPDNVRATKPDDNTTAPQPEQTQ